MTRHLKGAIWLYLFLLIFEGALRKWIFPGQADLILLIRDPVVLLIYGLAIADGKVPRNSFIILLAVLSVASVVTSFLAGQSNIIVIVYGIRTNYLHVPLIWVMAETLDRRDAERFGLAVLLAAIPITAIMIAQFESPREAWINRGVGGNEGGQLYGAEGRDRPPSVFSFITGPLVYYPLAAAFFCHFITATISRWLWWLVLACGLCIVIAMPMSISRGVMITTIFVGIVFLVCRARSGLLNANTIRIIVGGAVLAVILSYLPIFASAKSAFMSRWDQAASEVEGDAAGSLITRVTSGFTGPFVTMTQAPFFGHGIGVGSNFASKYLYGNMGFALAENEWDKVFLELGPIVGLGYIGMRCAITLLFFLYSMRALKQHSDSLPLLIWSAASPVILLQQWAPPTLLGFAVFGGGLLLSSLNYTDDDFAPISTDEDAPPDAPPPPTEIELQRRRMRGLA